MKAHNREQKLKEYSERHRFWRDKSIAQLGYSINLFTTLGIGLIAFLVSQRADYTPIIIDFDASVDFEKFIYVTSLGLAAVSILSGGISITSRLFDIRIASHVVYVRKRFLKLTDDIIPSRDTPTKKGTLIGAYLFFLVYPLGRIEEEDYKNKEELIKKFTLLRSQSQKLGSLTWLCHKLQIMALIVSAVFIGFSILG